MEEAGQTRTVRATKRVADVVVPPLRWILKRLPRIDARIGNTLSGRLGTIYSFLEKKDFAEAFRMSREALARCETPARRGFFNELRELQWWNLFECYSRSATELGEEERREVVSALARAPVAGGICEARCLDIFSRWRWTAGDQAGAIDFARRAVAADPTWPYGHITVAWYGLTTGSFDPLPSLREAVRASPVSLVEIRTNRDFANAPGLIAALEEGAREH
jgi:hypothetical protein